MSSSRSSETRAQDRRGRALALHALLGAFVVVAFAGDAAARQGKPLIVTSSAFRDGGDIPAQYTCEGVEQSPPLRWSEAPAGTKSIAILVSDPDAPTKTFTHWIVTGLPSGTTSIDEGVLPVEAVVGDNDKGKAAWAGPCPPTGRHRYVFRVFALDLALAEELTRTELRDAIAGHVIASGKLVGMYEKHPAR